MKAKSLLCTSIFLLALLWTGAVSAATNLGWYLYAPRPTLRAGFGNPTDWPAETPAPVRMNPGANGTYAHGTNSVTLNETNPVYIGTNACCLRWGGPGDSWSTLTLISPTPGSTRDTPIIYRFDSHITNIDSGVGYSTDGSTTDWQFWFFDQPATNVHFRVDWTIHFVGEPFTVQNCYFVPPFNYICTNTAVGSTGSLGVTFSIEGYGSQTLYPRPGGTAAIGPGNQTYSGTVSGIAIASRLGLWFDPSFYVGQSTRGDSRVIVEFRIYADVAPLPDVAGPPSLSLTHLPGNALGVSWPATRTGFVLQENTNLNTTHWTPVAQTPVDMGTNKVVTINPVGGNRFFRLFKP